MSLPSGPPRGALMLGHGAGGGVSAPDIVAARRAALGAGWAVALVEQPYRVAGKRSPVPAPRLDTAWAEVAAQLGDDALAGLPLICGGRSSGARVACRTVARTGAIGVLCLAFPLLAPGREGAATPARSRQPELDGAGVPVLVIQGAADRFGMPRGSKALDRTVVRIAGDHGLKRDLPLLGEAVADWLDGLVAPAMPTSGRPGRAEPPPGSR